MLPTTGFFKDIECPFFDNSCGRPYCHFRHRKKVPDQSDSPKQVSTEESEIPTYNPTPKSQLANPRTQSHIPIRYVPDLADLSNRSRKMSTDHLPIYRPTPLSMLPNFNKPGSCVGNQNKPTDNTESNSTLCSTLLDFPNVEYNPNELLKPDSINFEELSTEFDMIDDIINEFDDEDKNEELQVKNDEETTPQSESQQSLKHSQKRKLSNANDSSKAAVSDRATKQTRTKSPDHGKRDKKASNSEKLAKTKSESNSKKERNSKSSDKSKNHSSRHSDKEKHKSKSSGSKEKHKDRHRSSHKEKKLDEKGDNKNKDKIKTKHKITEKNEKKTSVNHGSSDSEQRRKRKEKHRDRHDKIHKVSSKQKEQTSDNDLQENDFGNSDVDFDSDDDTLQECYRIFTEYKPEQPILDLESKNSERKSIDESNGDEGSSVGKKRVAHEKAENIARKNAPAPPKPVANPALTMANRFKAARLAQANNEQNALIDAVKQQTTEILKRPSSKTLSLSAKQSVSGSTNKHATLSNTDNKKQINNTSRSLQSISLVDDIIAGNSKPRRIAPAQNVNSLQRAKAKIDELARQKAAALAKKTLAQTVGKGSSRVAHVPEFSLSDIPDVLESEKSKLPVNVRTRYLTMIADECVKLYLTTEDAYQRALNEEFKCYERCKVLTTYRNSAMLSVNRLRKEVQERAKQGLDPISSIDALKNNEVSELKGKRFYSNIKNYILTEEELVLHGYPRESSVPGTAMFPNLKSTNTMTLDENERKCARCSKIYFVDEDGLALYEQECLYHPLKKRTFRGESTYLCCKSSDDTGCVTSNTHVCEQTLETEMEGFQTTMEPESNSDSRSYAVYALDCEMCYTTKGLELTRVTIVDVECKTVYESLVKPLNTIIDYNTRFSGITKDQMDRTSTSILQVQANILHLCNSKTILIGHSLESDLKALKIVHNSIIDTSVLFPHKLGLPYKRALRNLASDYLKKIIQNDVSGHDSAEDALTCMELVIWKVKEDLKVRGIKLGT